MCRAEFGVRVGQLDVAAGQEGLQKRHVCAWVAGHLGEFWQRLAIGLAHIEHVAGLEAENRTRGRDVVSPDAIAGVMKGPTQRHRDQDRDAFLSAPDEASKLAPGREPGHTRGVPSLDVNQEVSSPGPGSNPTISTRKAQTVVTVSSGETMVLAGLIADTNTTGSSGVPLLSKIPLIGGLFGTQSLVKKRTELVLLITPTVVTSPEDARAVTEEIRRKLPSLEAYLPRAIK